MSSSHAPHRVGRSVARLSVLGLAVGSLLGGFTLLAGVTPAGAATNLYVSPSGSDTGNNCANASTPCLTLLHAYTEAAGSGSTINLAGGTYAGGITINKSVNIVGTNSGGSLDSLTSTINGGGFVLFIDSGHTVNISNVVITNASGIAGLANYSTLTLTNVNVVDNTGTFDGAGMFSGSPGSLVMTGGSVSGNTSPDGVPGGGFDQNGGTATFDNVAFNHDTATGSGGEGGAIFNFVGTIHLTGSTAIHNNSATLEGGGVFTCPGQTTTVGPHVSVTGNTPNDFSSSDLASEC
jgi:hypothetical protein